MKDSGKAKGREEGRRPGHGPRNKVETEADRKRLPGQDTTGDKEWPEQRSQWASSPSKTLIGEPPISWPSAGEKACLTDGSAPCEPWSIDTLQFSSQPSSLPVSTGIPAVEGAQRLQRDESEGLRIKDRAFRRFHQWARTARALGHRRL